MSPAPAALPKPHFQGPGAHQVPVISRRQWIKVGPRWQLEAYLGYPSWHPSHTSVQYHAPHPHLRYPRGVTQGGKPHPEGKLGDLAGCISAPTGGRGLLSMKDALWEEMAPPTCSPGETCTHIHVIPPHTYTPTKACTHEDIPQARPQQPARGGAICMCVCLCVRVRLYDVVPMKLLCLCKLPGRKQEDEEGKKPSGALSEARRDAVTMQCPKPLWP